MSIYTLTSFLGVYPMAARQLIIARKSAAPVTSCRKASLNHLSTPKRFNY